LTGLMYSPGPMEDRGERTEIGTLEEKVGELERIADSLGGVPDEELAGTLQEAVRLLGKINARLETGIGAVEEGSREASALLDGIDFGPFDEALETLERQERADDPDAT
jgi:hypothetical protein